MVVAEFAFRVGYLFSGNQTTHAIKRKNEIARPFSDPSIIGLFDGLTVGTFE